MKNKNLRQIIKKTIVENLNKKSCDCGCGGCSDTVKKPQLSLNENQINKTLISEGLNWHLTHQKPLTEQLYRAGSEKYFSLWKEARHLYSRGLFESTFEEDIEILTETNLGEFGFLEDGTRVPLDFPMEEENLTESTNYFIPKITNEQGANTFWEDDDDKITLQDILELTKDIKVINFPTKKLANIVLNWDNNPEEIERISQVKVSSQYPILIMADEEGKIQWILDGNHRAQKALRSKSETIPAKIITPSDLNSKAKKIFGLCEIENKISNLTESTNYFIPKVTKDKKHPNFLYINIPYPTGKGFLDALGTQTAAGQERQQGAKKALSIGQKIYDKIENHPDIEDIDITDLENGIVQIFIVSDTLTPEKLSDLTESKKENKPLNKPMRDSSGGKAYKVYVRDPKTKNIKTVRFGSGGLRAKINDPKARKAFAARHDCKNKKDRTKPSYWSCRLPRFANSLGLKGSFSGFW